ncbi:MAG: ComEA family DNA-binding protein [Actinomycetota bacterium]
MSRTAIGVGAVLLVIGGVVAGQAWSRRSSPPIDDLLPFLVGDGPAGTDAAGVPDRAEPVPAGPTQRIAGESVSDPSATDVTNHSSTAGGRSDPDEVDIGGTGLGVGVEGLPVEGVEVVVVHVSGAVARPGIVELHPPSRVHHAIDAAGGPRAEADLDRVNLAAPIHDGERLHVPAQGELDPPPVSMPVGPAIVPTSRVVGEFEAVSIDVNRASVRELEELPGVGPAIAGAIVELRDMRGPFANLDELLLVDGIGPAKLAALSSVAVAGP